MFGFDEHRLMAHDFSSLTHRSGRRQLRTPWANRLGAGWDWRVNEVETRALRARLVLALNSGLLRHSKSSVIESAADEK
jgi:hypothetical protein